MYPKLIFPSSIISLNSIIISDEDFIRLQNPYKASPDVEPGYHLFTFDIPQWIETTGYRSWNFQSSISRIFKRPI